jgi:arginine deiminase
MKQFSRIVEEYNFRGRDTNIVQLIDDIIQNVNMTFGEKSEFFNSYLHEDIGEVCGEEAAELYLEDLKNGKIKAFYYQGETVNYEELRLYLYNTYNFDLDNQTHNTYVDCIWLKHLIKLMTSKAIVKMNRE